MRSPQLQLLMMKKTETMMIHIPPALAWSAADNWQLGLSSVGRIEPAKMNTFTHSAAASKSDTIEGRHSLSESHSSRRGRV